MLNFQLLPVAVKPVVVIEAKRKYIKKKKPPGSLSI
jgi:hypothetical protein